MLDKTGFGEGFVEKSFEFEGDRLAVDRGCLFGSDAADCLFLNEFSFKR